MKGIAFFLLALLLSACTLIPTPISQQDAIQRALGVASTNQPELEPTGVQPTNLRAERMTFLAAAKRVWNADAVPGGQDPNLVVWVVTMDGEWRNAFPMPTDTPPQRPLRHFSFIVDAMTGDLLGSAGTP